MKILILTSSDHFYANIILSGLIRSLPPTITHITVYEQSSIIPSKTPFQGLLKYLRVSGLNYVLPQIIKQYLFIFRRFLATHLNRQTSIFYPYYLISPFSLNRQTVNNLKRPENIDMIRKLKPDLILSILSKEIIPSSILAIPKFGSVNIHPALLPYYKGVSPTFWYLHNQEKFAGVTLHFLDESIDTGAIISQKKFSTTNIKTEHQLYLRCCHEGLQLLISYLSNPKSRPRHQKKASGSYYSLPTKIAVRHFLHSGYKFYNLSDFLR